MFRSLLIASLLLFSTSAFAELSSNPCDNLAQVTKDLSQQETATILETCRGKSTTLSSLPSASTASEWATASKSFAEALGIAAKELGIAVNDFLDSPAGLILAVILVFNYMGGVIVGVPLVVFGLVLSVGFIKGILRTEIEYEYVPYLWGAFNIKRVKSYQRELTEGTVFTGICLFLGVMGTILITLANIT